MFQTILEYNNEKIAEITTTDRVINNLKTGLADDVLQKCVTYGVKVAIVGAFAKYNSQSLQAFIRECNRGRQIFFMSDLQMALQKLTM